MTRRSTAAQKFWRRFLPWMQHAWNVHGWRGSGHFRRRDSTLKIQVLCKLTTIPPHPHFQRAALTLKGLHKLCAEDAIPNPEENRWGLQTTFLNHQKYRGWYSCFICGSTPNSKQIWNHYNAWQLVDSVEKPHLLTGQTVLKPSDFSKSRLLTVWL